MERNYGRWCRCLLTITWHFQDVCRCLPVYSEDCPFSISRSLQVTASQGGSLPGRGLSLGLCTKFSPEDLGPEIRIDPLKLLGRLGALWLVWIEGPLIADKHKGRTEPLEVFSRFAVVGAGSGRTFIHWL